MPPLLSSRAEESDVDPSTGLRGSGSMPEFEVRALTFTRSAPSSLTGHPVDDLRRTAQHVAFVLRQLRELQVDPAFPRRDLLLDASTSGVGQLNDRLPPVGRMRAPGD